jgi:plastocyanin
MRRFSYLILGLAVLGGLFLIGLAILQPDSEEARVPEPAETEMTEDSTEQACAATSQAEVRVTSDGFEPGRVCLTVGGTVVWTNGTSSRAEVASDPHPEHDGYPGFYDQGGVRRGETYNFIFERAGTWGYHDHLNPNRTGEIVVVQ